jgi:hypothetical protein
MLLDLYAGNGETLPVEIAECGGAGQETSDPPAKVPNSMHKALRGRKGEIRSSASLYQPGHMGSREKRNVLEVGCQSIRMPPFTSMVSPTT